MSKTADFYEKDFWSGLFPMQTNLLLITTHETELSTYIYQKVLNDAVDDHNFLPQQRVHADKGGGHLRRTHKLDPVAEYFLYDVIYRNREIFRKPISESRKSFGYRFEGGEHIPIGQAYKSFKTTLSEHLKAYGHHLTFDIAAYFNTIYHHDLANWFSSYDKVTETDQAAFGKFCREINSGRSVDFLPHGLYPTKMIGSEFIKFIEQSGQLKSARFLRFMDDFHLFDNDERVVQHDFALIQRMLGAKGLNVNPNKTRKSINDVESAVSEIRKTLFEIIEIESEPEYFSPSSWNEPEMQEVEVEIDLTKKQVRDLLSLLKQDEIDDHDVELILNLLRTHSSDIGEYVPVILERFPSTSKVMYSTFSEIKNKNKLAESVHDFLTSTTIPTEFQLFWLATLTEQQLSKTPYFGKILNCLYEASSNSVIARAKILEISEQRFGMKELRDEHLKNGSSNWLSWASAVGTRTLKKAERNYSLDYFSKGSAVNYLVSSCVKK